VRIYEIRHWTGQGHKQVSDQMGWTGFQVRSDVAILLHQALVNCAFSFCWTAWFSDLPRPVLPLGAVVAAGITLARCQVVTVRAQRQAVCGSFETSDTRFVRAIPQHTCGRGLLPDTSSQRSAA
jgi:hypothetical protein